MTFSRLEIFLKNNDISIPLSEFLMKMTGCWLATTVGEKIRRMIAWYYTVAMMLIAMYVIVLDICHSFDDVNYLIYMIANLCFSVAALIKNTLLQLNKERFLKLVTYTQRNFWHTNYDDDEKEFVNAARRKFTFIILFQYSVMIYVPCSYVYIPVYENIGRNDSERELPFRLWFNLPLQETPCFELTFTAQALCIFHVGISYLGPDNFLILLTTHTACQFRILQYKLLHVLDPNSEMIDLPDYADQCYQSLKRYIRQHQALINYCNRIEIVFSFNMFSYVLAFSVVTCLSLYEGLLGEISTLRRLSFVLYVGGCVFQLLVITNCCGSMITESTNVGAVAYEISWAALSMKKSGRSIRRDVQMMILRSQKPCELTAGGFFPISLQTSTKLLSSAMSYFTLLKQSSSNLQDT